MRKLLGFAIAAVAVLAGCGTDTCSSGAATPQDTTGGTNCAVAPVGAATINVRLCSKCNDSSPSCQAEFVNGRFEVAPVVQQCQADSGCAIAGCNYAVPTATCTVTLPASATSGSSYDLVVVGEGPPVYNTLSVGGSGTSCTL